LRAGPGENLPPESLPCPVGRGPWAVGRGPWAVGRGPWAYMRVLYRARLPASAYARGIPAAARRSATIRRRAIGCTTATRM